MTDLLAGRIDTTITTFITAAPLHVMKNLQQVSRGNPWE